MSQPLLHRVGAGEPGAVQEAMDRFGGLVWSLARRFCASPTDAEDLTQEIFLNVWKSAAKYDETIGSETTYVAMIARRRLIDHVRKETRRRTEAMSEFDDIPQMQATPGEHREEVGTAMAALSELSDEQQRVIRLSIHSGLSHEKIAKATGLPIGTVKTHIRRGLKKVRDGLEAMHSGAHSGRMEGAT